MNFRVSDIEWDLSIDDDDDGLPPTDLPASLIVSSDGAYAVEVGQQVGDEYLIDTILNALSNEYGWCIYHCNIIRVEDGEAPAVSTREVVNV